MRIIAFDQSTTATGWAVADTETQKLIEFGVIKPKGNLNDRIREMMLEAYRLSQWYEVSEVYLEDIFARNNVSTLIKLAKLLGCLEIYLEGKGYPVHIIQPTEWRKRVDLKNGKRKEVKAQAIDMIKQQYDIEPSEDECEAILFAMAFTKEEVNETESKR
ncbi:hypothetical protein CL176_02170 [Suicoccus acidiformans]|uniref:Uncharacterized protein n=1 Tax=Suicoccus acidiformans TaxID=2036206 RepID=A0A347WIL7_9LACT|nr:crossover junction endodeoxyribonuclease RuvC [Suicoccus acidiformans]AXY24924.1 hypothetical protein CL176_02170 [Suicoccus acidiformans]